jgi:hypothetical protein
MKGTYILSRMQNASWDATQESTWPVRNLKVLFYKSQPLVLLPHQINVVHILISYISFCIIPYSLPLGFLIRTLVNTYFSHSCYLYVYMYVCLCVRVCTLNSQLSGKRLNRGKFICCLIFIHFCFTWWVVTLFSH